MNKAIPDGLYAAFDLGTAALKAAIIEVNNSRPRLATLEEDKIKPIGEFPSEEEYRVHLVESLQNISSRLPLKDCRKVSVLFSNREMQVKVIELPAQVQGEQIEKILNWEAKKLLSPAFRDEPYAFAYKVVRETPYSVALAVIPQRLLEKFMDLFEDAGISVDGAFAEVFSAHSLNDSVDQTGLPALSIVNFGHTGTHLQIFSAGELRFYRYIPSGMAEMSTPPKESELEMYSQKIRFSFDYFRAVSKLSQIDAVFFMGGGAAQPNILPFERTYFNPTRINIVDISSHIDISPILPEIGGASLAEEKQRRLLPFLPAVGTILSMFSEDSAPMNLAIRLKKKRSEKRLQELSKTLPVLIAIGGLIVILGLLFYMKTGLKSKLLDLEKQLDLSRINAEATNIKIARYRAAADTGIKLSPAARKTLAPVLADQYSIAQILFQITKNKVKGLNVTEVLIRNSVEAENINLETSQDSSSYSDSNASMMADEDKNEFLSTLSADSVGNDLYNEGLGGKILILKGTCDDNDSLAAYIESLSKERIIRRLKSVVSLKRSTRQLEFLVKGEMQ